MWSTDFNFSKSSPNLHTGLDKKISEFFRLKRLWEIVQLFIYFSHTAHLCLDSEIYSNRSGFAASVDQNAFIQINLRLLIVLRL